MRPVQSPPREIRLESKENPHRADLEESTQQTLTALPTPLAPRAPVELVFPEENLDEPGRARLEKRPQAGIEEISDQAETIGPEHDGPRTHRQPDNWRDELSERVENYRKRRGRLQPEAGPFRNMELDFEGLDIREDNPSAEEAPAVQKSHNPGFDLEIGESLVPPSQDDPLPEPAPLAESHDEIMQLDAAPAESHEMTLGESAPRSAPMEILVSSPDRTVAEDQEQTGGILLAPLSRRFLAGLTDALVLILGAAVFGIIFWRCCGRLSFVPLNIGVLGLVAVIFIFAYFAAFTAIAFATPGLLCVGCTIRSMSGGHPTLRESLWRAFGVLVSLSALMLGFVWAFVDSDGLTWHDRMSQTVITEGVVASDLAGIKAVI